MIYEYFREALRFERYLYGSTFGLLANLVALKPLSISMFQMRHNNNRKRALDKEVFNAVRTLNWDYLKNDDNAKNILAIINCDVSWLTKLFRQKDFKPTQVYIVPMRESFERILFFRLHHHLYQQCKGYVELEKATRQPSRHMNLSSLQFAPGDEAKNANIRANPDWRDTIGYKLGSGA